jgi:hypothetical protein
VEADYGVDHEKHVLADGHIKLKICDSGKIGREMGRTMIKQYDNYLELRNEVAFLTPTNTRLHLLHSLASRI